MKISGVFLVTCFIFSVVFISGANSQIILSTKHNLSRTGPGPIKAVAEEEVCIFCHTPHKARRDIPYLWNRNDSTVNYIPYQSSTLYSTVDQPTGASKLCLSCHDGTIALGALVSEPFEIPFEGGIRFIPEGPTRIGTDLSDDHPISFLYDDILSINNNELVNPLTLPPEVKLDSDSLLQCTACHDPHKNTHGKFLVLSNIYSNLCTACHTMNSWNLSDHSTSTAFWNGAGSDPWPHTEFTTVTENGCENCHKPHTAGKHERLLNYAFEEDNCLVCHNGNVAVKNIEPEFSKLYRHAVQDYTNVHDAAEDFSSGNVLKHIECSDCHNPHYANATSSPGAPQVSGLINGVSGIDSSGQNTVVAVNEYEICYKCHADNNVLSVISIDRQIQDLNTRLEFNQSNPSFHPVETVGVNLNVPSLIPPYTTASIIFCSDCHNSDNPTGPRGPHGSNNKYLLEKNYTTDDNTPETSFDYELCYKCHDRTSILADQSFPSHALHIQTANSPCSACHDAHGISALQGNSTNNSHLINFDISIVQPDGMGRILFEDLGVLTGQCFLTCHGVSHDPPTHAY
jgi:predicted CXXCH cytochrome family protein